MFGTTPGNIKADSGITIIVTNPGCTYSVGASTADDYLNPAISNDIDPKNTACDFQSSDSSATNCPLDYLLYFPNANGN